MKLEQIRTPGVGPFAVPLPDMRGRYLIRSSARKAKAMAVIDAVLNLRPRRTPAIPSDPARILIANWAHLGDVITTYGALTALRERFPRAHIGMIVASWSKAAIASAGLVDQLHVVDHHKLSRANLARAEMKARHRATQSVALREIREAQYQVAIDLFPFYPQAHPLFWRAGIPVRIGYTSGGFGPLLTHPVEWRSEERPMGDQYRDLLNLLSPDQPFAPAALRPRRDPATLVPLPDTVRNFGSYLVIHPGAGSPSRYWGVDRWTALIRELGGGEGEHRIVLTGAGEAEMMAAGALQASFPSVIDLSGRISWEEFTSVLAHATLVVSPDTAAGHVAALFNRPIVSIFTGTNSPAKWAPYADDVHVLVKSVLCSPCNRVGCEAMECFRGVPPDRVANALRGMLSRSGTTLDPGDDGAGAMAGAQVGE